MAMKAKVERDWMRGGYKIWLYEVYADMARTLRSVDGTVREWIDHDHAATTLPEPTFYLTDREADALIPELSGLPGASDATVNHLQDAIKVRDRLLSMVEGRQT